jgi:hypothetical protein
VYATTPEMTVVLTNSFGVRSSPSYSSGSSGTIVLTSAPVRTFEGLITPVGSVITGLNSGRTGRLDVELEDSIKKNLNF